ncbi:MAG TPA: hypothetical protein PKC70_12635 [Cellvibrionaceae bacterium]|nr:hypothetical protein [Cellvibrionaceae bacterium]
MAPCKLNSYQSVFYVIRLMAKNIILSLSIFMQTACEANMFTKEDVVLFSKVQGRVVHNGVPVANAKVIRRYRYDTPQPIEDSCVTNSQGEFELPVVVKKNATVTPLAQFVVYQQLYVERDGQQQQIWSHGKMHTEENSEYDGSFNKIICELTAEPVRINLKNYDHVFTNCVWDK